MIDGQYYIMLEKLEGVLRVQLKLLIFCILKGIESFEGEICILLSMYSVY